MRFFILIPSSIHRLKNLTACVVPTWLHWDQEKKGNLRVRNLVESLALIICSRHVQMWLTLTFITETLFSQTMGGRGSKHSLNSTAQNCWGKTEQLALFDLFLTYAAFLLVLLFPLFSHTVTTSQLNLKSSLQHTTLQQPTCEALLKQIKTILFITFISER